MPGGPDDLGALDGTDGPEPDADPATAPYGYGPLTFEEALDTARRLAPEFAAPVDCRRPPLDNSILMPNAPRHYRAGTHEGVGHAASLYVHLDAVHPGLRVGQPVNKGTLLGGVGNTGTVAAASGDPHRSLHLHWEIHINGRYLAEGQSRSDTRAVYAALFGLDNP